MVSIMLGYSGQDMLIICDILREKCSLKMLQKNQKL